MVRLASLAEEIGSLGMAWYELSYAVEHRGGDAYTANVPPHCALLSYNSCAECAPTTTFKIGTTP